MGTVVEAISELLNFPEIDRFLQSSPRSDDANHPHRAAGFPVDIIESAKEYVFYIDVPGLSKSDIQVTVEGENTVVIKSNGKRKREEEGGEEGCKYIRLERRPAQKLMRKFRLPEDCNLSALSGKCENGVLRVAVEKVPPPPKPKTLQVSIS